MKILVQRIRFTAESTISDVLIDGVFVGHILEDTDRGLDAKDPLDQIKQVKVYAKTAIPTGTYEVAVNFSSRFEKQLPLLLNVPGFAGIRIHPGNWAKDTEGCLLPGYGFSKNMVTDSRSAFTNWFLRIQAALRKEKVTITITRDEKAYQAFVAEKDAALV